MCKFIFGGAGPRGCCGVSLAARVQVTPAVLRGAPPRWPLWRGPRVLGARFGGCSSWARRLRLRLRSPARRLWPSGFLVPGHVRPSQTRSQASHAPRVGKRVQSAEPAGGRLLQSAPASPRSPGRAVKPPGVRGSSQRGAFRQGPRGSLSLSLPESQSPERAGLARSAPLGAPSFH